MCGLCLPHCPTYRVSRNEGESPRGRISLIKAYAQGNLPAGAAVQTHMQSCTACMKCEQVCPANVAFHSILDSGRWQYRRRLDFKTRSLQTLGVYLLCQKWGRRLFKILQTSAAAWARLGIFATYETTHLAMAIQKKNYKKPLPEIISSDKNVTVFTGCSGQLLDRETFASTLKMLAALNYMARIPAQNLCCGALAQHSGLIEMAARQRQKTHEHLHSQDVISFASGCGRQLETDGVNGLARHYDIHTWLLQDNKLNMLRFRPLAKNVMVHIPCSMEADQIQAMTQALQTVPGVSLQMFEDDLHCCGAGGMQILTPQASNRELLQSKIDTIKASRPDLIVTANIGCALQLQKGLLQAKLDIPVLHTVTLLAGQLRD